MTITGTVRMALLILLLLLPAMCGFAKEQTDYDGVDVMYDHIAVDELSFNFSRGQDAMYIYVDDTLELNITINSELAPGIIVFQSSNEKVFEVDDSEGIEITLDTNFPFTITVSITGKFIGIEKLLGIYYSRKGGDKIQMINYVIKVNRLPVFTQSFMQYVLMFWMIFSYITMGAKSDISVIKEKLARPWAVLIGMTCQFLIMPSLAFGLSHLFALDDSAAVGLIVDGSCPGGWLSNAFTVLLDLDFVLSLTMIFCSTFIALGMMPLNLFLYTRKFTAENDQLTIPYLELAIQLCMLIIPVGIGILIVTKFPKFKLICDKILKPVATGLVAIGLAVTLPFDHYCFLAGFNIYAAAITLPLIGGFLGLALAKLACLRNRAAITVAIETGSQNALLALTMVKLFYPLPEADLVSRIPLLVVIFTLMEGIIITCFYLFYKNVYLGYLKSEDDSRMTSIDKEPADDNGNKEMRINTTEKSEKGIQTKREGIQNPVFLEEEVAA